MSSSSSESEDDSRFRQACDPTLSLPYGSNLTSKLLCINNENPDYLGHRSLNESSDGVIKGQEIHDNKETRESLLLARKIQGLINAKDIKDVVSGINSQRVNYTKGDQPSVRRKKNDSRDDKLPSTLSSYLDKKLTRLLDEKVEIKITDDVTENPNLTEFDNNGLLLLKNKIVKSCTGLNSSSKNKMKKKTKKAAVSNLYNENEVAERCQSIALSPNWILSMQDVYPWPHPKNIRYIDKYKLKNRKADGSIVAVPLEDDHEEVNKLKRKQEKVKCDKSKRRTGKDNANEQIEENTSVTDGKKAMKKTKRVKSDNSLKVKLINGAKHTANNDDVSDTCAVKKRKQSRKRSGKKAKRNVNFCSSL